VHEYKVTYKDGSSEIIDAATYKLDGGPYVFKDGDGDEVSRVITGEVRSMTKLKE
jgi:hypothetical protein